MINQISAIGVNRGDLLAILSAIIILSGCGNHTDITGDWKIQHPGFLGREFRTTRQLDLVEDKPSDTLRLAEPSYPSYSRTVRVGEAATGTTLVANRVTRVTELSAFLVFLPVYYTWDCKLGKICDGPFAGREVAIGGQGVELDNGIATITGRCLVPATAPGGK